MPAPSAAIRKLATQANHNVAISRSGDLYSWGFGETGQLRNGKSADEACPALVEVDGVAGKVVLDGRRRTAALSSRWRGMTSVRSQLQTRPAGGGTTSLGRAPAPSPP